MFVFEMYSAYADLGLLVLMYLQCSLYLVFTFHSVCPIYAFPKVWPVSLYIPNFSGSFSLWHRSFIRCDIVFVGLNAVCFGMSLNKLLSPYKYGQWDLRQQSRKHTQYNRDLHNQR